MPNGKWIVVQTAEPLFLPVLVSETGLLEGLGVAGSSVPEMCLLEFVLAANIGLLKDAVLRTASSLVPQIVLLEVAHSAPYLLPVVLLPDIAFL